VHSTWEKKKTDCKNLESELNDIKSKLSDKSWCRNIENKIISNKLGGILQEELRNVAKGTVEKDEIVIKKLEVDSKNLRI
jgi:hypothetical protein